ncbi:hypothetical protein KFU94_58300 [Chloroflexi bacterium TSY]|nr:hypothetical protein [Chloroflexi bacterium TSY]
MPQLKLQLLGPPRLTRDGTRVDIGRRKAVALLAYLATTGQIHGRDSLAALFWPEYDQTRARTDLRRMLSVLNRALGEGWFETDRETICMVRGANSRICSGHALWLDVAEFRRCLMACEAHDHSADQVCTDCLPLLEAAVTLYRDDFLAGFTLEDSPDFDDWQSFESQSLRRELASALERLVHGYSKQGEFEPAISHARH